VTLDRDFARFAAMRQTVVVPRGTLPEFHKTTQFQHADEPTCIEATSKPGCGQISAWNTRGVIWRQRVLTLLHCKSTDQVKASRRTTLYRIIPSGKKVKTA